MMQIFLYLSAFITFLESLIFSEIVSLVYELLSPPCSSCIEERPNVNSPLFLPHFAVSLLEISFISSLV